MGVKSWAMSSTDTLIAELIKVTILVNTDAKPEDLE